METLCENVLNMLNIKFRKSWLRKNMVSMPYKNSFFFVQGIMSGYNVDSKCYRLINKNSIHELDLSNPCVVTYRGDFYVLKEVTKTSVVLIKKRSNTIELDEFLRRWDRVVMIFSANSLSQEPNYSEHLREDRGRIGKNIGIILLVIALCSIELFVRPENLSRNAIFILAINVIGVFIAYLLLQKQMHIENEFADRLCNLSKSSCDTVMDSRGGTLFGTIKLSEIGMGFFAVNVLILLFIRNCTPSLALISICSLPFTFWSILYQKYKIKNWCVLCLVSVALLWLQASAYTLSGNIKIDFYNVNYLQLVSIVISYMIATLLVNHLTGNISVIQRNKSWQLKYNELKMQNSVVNAIMDSSSLYRTDDSSCTSLVFGNYMSKNQITIFSNPYCGPCALMHKRLHNMAKKDVCIKYVLTSFSKQLSTINRYIIAAYFKYGPDKTWQILTKWYAEGVQQGELFFKSYNLDINKKHVDEEMKKHARWSRDERLQGTPTVLFNGRELIEPYKIEDYYYLPQ